MRGRRATTRAPPVPTRAPGGGDAGSASDGGAWLSPVLPVCAGSYGAPVATQGITDTSVKEASGIAASPINRDVVWVHNDSGDSPRLFALRIDGTGLGRLNLVGAPSGDWEDLASAPCPDRSGPCLWVEDHSGRKVYAVPEPTVAANAPFGELFASDYWAFSISYPNGATPDVEALLLEPDGSAFYLFEKTANARARLYRAASVTAKTASLAMVEVGSVASPGAVAGQGGNITGGDLHPSRERLLLRTYLAVFEYRLHPGDFPGNLDAAERRDFPVSVSLELAGEAVTYDQTGKGLLTVSEGFLGAPGEPLHRYACQ